MAPSTRGVASTRSSAGLLGATLLVLLLTQYPTALLLGFSNDDYLILDKLKHVSFVTMWAPQDLLSNYFRPWSRELHYWVLTRLFGPNPAPFHVVSFGLWFSSMGLYFVLLRRLIGTPTAVLGTCLVATQAAWGTLLVWPAGSQDLWMIFTSLLFLIAFVQRHTMWAAAALIVALLSKEPAGTLPAIAASFVLLVERGSVRDALRRTAAFWPLVAAWAWVHPHLGGGYHPWGYLPHSVGADFVLSIRQLVNLDHALAPVDGWLNALALGAPAAGALALTVWIALRTSAHRDEQPDASTPPWRVATWGASWALLGWLPIIAPGIRWHAYYCLWGAFGAWAAISLVLRKRPHLAITAVLCLAVLRPARTNTPQYDLGSEWYHRRAASITETIRSDLVRMHPTFPARSRVYFTAVPGGVGLVAAPGYSPHLSTWYADTTIRGYFYSHYEPRPASTLAGADHFFVSNSAGRLREVIKGAEPSSGGVNPSWLDDHRHLALIFFQKGDLIGCAGEFEKIVAAYPDSSDFAYNLAVCYEYLGDGEAAGRFYRKAASLPGATAEAVQAAQRFAQ